ncbi:MAG: HD-GYP domain-containing protein [Solirubrobacterales bacterium]
MKVLTQSASISFDATALVDRASDFYALERLTAGLDARMPGSFGHSRRVARLAASTAKQLRLPRAQVTRVRQAGALHDIGKVEVPTEIINKPGPLTDEEFAQVKWHAVAGADMIARSGSGDEQLAEIVRHHHERYDGSGYPDGLAGEAIPIGARIVAVADTFDAVTSPRPYRPALSRGDAMDLLDSEAGKHLDPAVVGAFRGRYSGLRGYLGRRRVAFRG